MEPIQAIPLWEKRRYHDLDALRAVAMLLGILLHGAMSFFPVPIWPAQDIHQPEVVVPAPLANILEQGGIEAPRSVNLYEMLVHAIHGFRLPLFFLVSGIFTAMLWKTRGLTALAEHRAKRILVPLVIFLPLVWLFLVPASKYGAAQQAKIARQRGPTPQVVGPNNKPSMKNTASPAVGILPAIRNGNLAVVEQSIRAGVDVNLRGVDQATLLMTAASFGRVEIARMLVGADADLNLQSGDGSTALARAVFFAHPEIVELLLEAGADVNIRNNNGATPLDVAQLPWEEIKPIYGLVRSLVGANGPDMDYGRIREARPKIVAMLKQQRASGGEAESDDLAGLVMLIFFAPIFHHLWFLYYLIWLLAGFLVIAWLLQTLKCRALPNWLVTSPVRLLWLLPVTFLSQLLMQENFGPATATGFLPWPPILLYYSVFFFFGAVCYGRTSFETKVGKLWPLSFVLAVPPLLAGVCLVESQSAGALLALCSVLYAWSMVFGFIGFFRRFFWREDRRVRYISDASYWLYIMHLPVLMFVQALVSPWDMPSLLKFLIACGATTVSLLILYEFGVRYTPIGTMLNGPRTRGPSTE